MGEGREREDEGSNQETTERQFPVFREHQTPPVPVGGCMCGNETGSGRESEEQAHTFLPVIHSPLLPDPAAHVPTPVGVAGGGKKTAHPAPTPKYKQLSLNQNCLSRLSPALGREGHMASDLRLATRGGGGPSNGPRRGVSPRTRETGVSTSKQLGGHRREWVGPGS